MISEDLLRYNYKQEFILFDEETAHLSLIVDNLPWQISWIIFNQNETLTKFNYYINWGKRIKISRQAAEITGYDEQLVLREGKSPEEVYKIFMSYLLDEKYLLCGHNIFGFDTMITSILARELGYKEDYSYLNRCYDTNCLAKAIKAGIKPDRENMLQWQFKLCHFFTKGVKTTLGQCAKDYSIELDESKLHDADFDTNLNMQIFLKQIRQLEI
jgi:DNA polymerase III alpha subunit (gram-positive type)